MPVNPSIEAAILPHLSTAQATKVGLCLEFLSHEDANAYRQRVYAVISENPKFKEFELSVNGHELWIVKKVQPDG